MTPQQVFLSAAVRHLPLLRKEFQGPAQRWIQDQEQSLHRFVLLVEDANLLPPDQNSLEAL